MAGTKSRAWMLLQGISIRSRRLSQQRTYSQSNNDEATVVRHKKSSSRIERRLKIPVLEVTSVSSSPGVGGDTSQSTEPTPLDLSESATEIVPFEDKLVKILEEIELHSSVRDANPSSTAMGPPTAQENDGMKSEKPATSKSDSIAAQGQGNLSGFRRIDRTSGIYPPQIRGVGALEPWIYTTVKEVRHNRRNTAMRGGVVGFVPTMGALHEGHLDLMRAAAKKCRDVWVSVYVNPTQFGATEDLSTYPSTWTEDMEKIRALNDELLSQGLGRVTAVFRPESPEVLYPYGIEGTSYVSINPELTQILEGSSRPTFFRGVTTVVTKLLNIVQPEFVFFGQKDIQQFAVIKRMIKEFHIPTIIQRVPTTREESGLAMSSRNAYLGHRRRTVAPLLFHMLSRAKQVFDRTEWRDRTRKLLIDTAMEVYNEEKDAQQGLEFTKPEHMVNFKLDYLSLADPDTLQEIPDYIGSRGAIMSVAIYFEPLDQAHIGEWERLGINGDTTTVRLIDNMLLGVDEDGIQNSVREEGIQKSVYKDAIQNLVREDGIQNSVHEENSPDDESGNIENSQSRDDREESDFVLRI